MAAAPSINGHASDTSSQTSKIQPSDVGWQFVPQYYNFVNKQPHRLHCFYNKRSAFVHGEEGEDAQTALGQQEIHDRIAAIGYDECKVFIHSIDSQSSANGGIIILVIGEMSNKGSTWRKFTQTFFLAEQPNGYFVLNDIFRYLKEDVDDEDELEEPSQQEAAVEVPADAPSVPDAAPVPMPDTRASTPVPEPIETVPTPPTEPEPVQAPAHPDPAAVPDEAVVASVPDEDTAPEEAALAVEEPVESAPAADETPAPTEKVASPAPAAVKPAPSSNGPSSSPAPPAAAPAAPAPSGPPKPKTWASLAAAGGAAKAWGSASPASTVAPTPAAPAPAPKKPEVAPAPAPAPTTEGKHPFYINALKATSPICFTKLNNWRSDGAPGGEPISNEQIRQLASRFGEVKSIDLAKGRTSAFVEFAKVEAARKAIIASLPPNQGGEGGVKVEGHSIPLIFETRKDKEDRGKGPGPNRQDGPQRGPRQGQMNGERGQQQGGRGGRGGRGRGGAPGGAQQSK